MHRQLGVLLHPFPDDQPDGIVARLAEVAGQIPKSFFNVVFECDRPGVPQQQRGAAKHDLQISPGEIGDSIGGVFEEGSGVRRGHGALSGRNALLQWPQSGWE